jgi:hypothetical protein
MNDVLGTVSSERRNDLLILFALCVIFVIAPLVLKFVARRLGNGMTPSRKSRWRWAVKAVMFGILWLMFLATTHFQVERYGFAFAPLKGLVLNPVQAYCADCFFLLWIVFCIYRSLRRN